MLGNDLVVPFSKENVVFAPGYNSEEINGGVYFAL